MFNLMPWRKERTAGALSPENLSFALMRREFAPLFDRFFGRFPLDTPELMEYPVWGFKTDETEKEIVVRAEAPGFEVGDFEVSLLGDVLLITAAHKSMMDKKEKGKGETVRAEMKRYVTLPPGIDPARVEAFYRNGVLEVRLPKSREAEGRRIEVKV